MDKSFVISPGTVHRRQPVHVFVARNNVALTFSRRFNQLSLNVFENDMDAARAASRCHPSVVVIGGGIVLWSLGHSSIPSR